MTLNLSNTTDFPMWKIFKFILFIIFVSFSFNVAKSKEGEIWTFYINACNHTDNQSYSHIAAYE